VIRLKTNIQLSQVVYAIFSTLLLLLTPITSAQIIQSYSYDPNGNMLSDGAYCYVYNDANQMSQAKNCTNSQLIAEYVYDHMGQRAIKKQYTAGVLNYTVYYIGEVYETKVYANGTTENTSYYFANGVRVARKDKTGVVYYHGDHLGSASVLTNSSGTLIEETTYLPFGSVKSGGTKSTFLYTDQENDPETGLYYYGARYYDPELMRFAEADPTIPDIYDPQSLNRYSYVKNNPLKYTDPTGLAYWVGALTGILNVAGGMAEAQIGAPIAIFGYATVLGAGAAFGETGGAAAPVAIPAMVVGSALAVVGTMMVVDGLATVASGSETYEYSLQTCAGTEEADRIDQASKEGAHPVVRGVINAAGGNTEAADKGNIIYGAVLAFAKEPSLPGVMKTTAGLVFGEKEFQDMLEGYMDQYLQTFDPVSCPVSPSQENGEQQAQPPANPQQPPASPTDPNQEDKK
jgi:RHS repeat-associated protein